MKADFADILHDKAAESMMQAFGRHHRKKEGGAHRKSTADLREWQEAEFRPDGKTEGHSRCGAGAPFLLEKWTMKRLKDRIADRSEPYDDNRLYLSRAHDCSEAARGRALDAAETLLALAAAGKLDATDLRIIEERSRSPMPSLREVADVVLLDVANVLRRTQRVKRLMQIEIRRISALSRNNPSL